MHHLSGTHRQPTIGCEYMCVSLLFNVMSSIAKISWIPPFLYVYPGVFEESILCMQKLIIAHNKYAFYIDMPAKWNTRINY